MEWWDWLRCDPPNELAVASDTVSVIGLDRVLTGAAEDAVAPVAHDEDVSALAEAYTTTCRISTTLSRISYPLAVIRRDDATPVRAGLANAELAVMELLWDGGRATARQIRERLYADKTNQHGTVQRLLQRLEQKGYVARDSALSVHLFSATVSREEYATSALESLAERLTGGSLVPLMTRLVEQKRISRAEIEDLRRILEEDAKPEEGE